MKHTSLTLPLLLIMLLAPMGSFGQSKEFKKEWKKLMEPVYYKSTGESSGMPAGNATFRIFGFKDKTDYAAKFLAEGLITNSIKGNKEYTFSLSNGKFSISDPDLAFDFKGDFALDVSYSKADKCPKISIIFGEGSMTQDGKTFTVKDAWSKDIGILEILLDGDYKGMPPLDIDTSNFRMPRVVTEVRSATPSATTLSDLSKGRGRVTEDEALFLYSILAPGATIGALPNYKEEYVVVKINGSDRNREFSRGIIGDSYEFNGGKVNRNGNKVRLFTNGHPQVRNLCADCLIDGGVCTLTSVNFNGQGLFEKGTLERVDGSKLAGITFDPRVINDNRGHILDRIVALDAALNTEKFDFNDLAQSYGMKVATYISPSGQPEDLIDNKIITVEKRMADLRQEEAQWGGHGFIEVKSIELGNAVSGDYVDYDVKYTRDLNFMKFKINLTSHTSIDRKVPFDIKIFGPSGNLVRGVESLGDYSLCCEAVVTPGMTELVTGEFNNYDPYQPGTYTVELWHNGTKLGTAKKTLSQAPASAKFVDVDKTYNYYDSDRGMKGLYITFGIETVSLKGQPLTVSMKFYHPNGKPATYQGKQLSQVYTITPPYEETRYSDQYFFFSNSYMYSSFPGRFGELQFRMEIRTKGGKLLDTYKGSVLWK